MIIGVKEEIGIAEEMTSSVLGSRARSAHYCVRRVHSELCKHCYLARSVGAR